MINSIIGTFNTKVAHTYPNNLIVGTFLYGSQNYNLDTENSDVDVISIVCPSWDNIIYAEKPISTTIQMEEGSIKVVDVRLALRDMRRPTIFSLEPLYTKYKLVDPMFKRLWDYLEQHKDLIAFGDIDATVASCVGMARQVYHDFHTAFNKGEMTTAKKKAARLVFIAHFLSNFLGTSSIEDCYWCDEDTKKDYFDLRTNDEDILAKTSALLEYIENIAMTTDAHTVSLRAASELDLVKRHIIHFALGENTYGKI